MIWREVSALQKVSPQKASATILEKKLNEIYPFLQREKIKAKGSYLGSPMRPPCPHGGGGACYGERREGRRGPAVGHPCGSDLRRSRGKWYFLQGSNMLESAVEECLGK